MLSLKLAVMKPSGEKKSINAAFYYSKFKLPVFETTDMANNMAFLRWGLCCSHLLLATDLMETIRNLYRFLPRFLEISPKLNRLLDGQHMVSKISHHALVTEKPNRC